MTSSLVGIRFFRPKILRCIQNDAAQRFTCFDGARCRHSLHFGTRNNSCNKIVLTIKIPVERRRVALREWCARIFAEDPPLVCSLLPIESPAHRKFLFATSSNVRWNPLFSKVLFDPVCCITVHHWNQPRSIATIVPYSCDCWISYASKTWVVCLVGRSSRGVSSIRGDAKPMVQAIGVMRAQHKGLWIISAFLLRESVEPIASTMHFNRKYCDA